MVSQWQQHNIGNLIIESLRVVQDDGHHFGRPYLTAYQLAIEFDRRHHDDRDEGTLSRRLSCLLQN
jgi:hypothetical protein